MRIKFVSVFFIALFVLASSVHAEQMNEQERIIHILNRAAYGPSPGDIEEISRIGIDAYIEQQLHPERMTLSAQTQSQIAELKTINASMSDLLATFEPSNRMLLKQNPDLRKQVNQDEQSILEDLIANKIIRAVESPAQLKEVMVDFWFNHFNVFHGKDLDRVFISSYERDAIRPYVLGHFRDLLGATAHHPAMLFYLDNWLNTDPNSLQARGKQNGINENYAREIMELHTLGVDGGYAQQDVTTLAHILTGWGVGKGPDITLRSEFYFDPQRHDWNSKQFLGQTIQGSGDSEVERVLDILARHPSTAKHISFELAQYFVADEPPEGLVNKMAQTFMNTGGDISSVLSVMFKSEEFWDKKYYRNKFKPPFRYVVSSLRATGFVPNDFLQLQHAIGGMGEPLYNCQTPNGYANTNDAWLNSDAVLKRINIAKALGHAATFGSSTATLGNTLGNDFSDTTRQAVNASPPQMQAILVLGSPEFLYY